MQAAVDHVSRARVASTLHDLTHDAADRPTSRHVSSSNNGREVGWARSRLAAYGLRARLQPFRSDQRRLANVVATIRGTGPGRVGVGAHIDSMSESGEARTLAPGADDEGSGVVAAMEAGRVIARYARGCLTRSVDVALFNDEEEGMRGSETYAASVKGGMVGFVNLDMIGNGGTPAVVASYSDDARDEPIARAVAAARTAYGVTGLRLSVSRYRDDDQDAASFWAEDIPVTYMYEEEMSPHWHEITDTVENVNVDQIELRTKAVVGAIVDLAR
ncbi:MAG TPA: M28 family peptidase [Mycobacteriales bacterium]|nr:M28 family peptidase [Mycobacteriales bacterium]